jgi:hypothetical protein
MVRNVIAPTVVEAGVARKVDFTGETIFRKPAATRESTK